MNYDLKHLVATAYEIAERAIEHLSEEDAKDAALVLLMSLCDDMEYQITALYHNLETARELHTLKEKEVSRLMTQLHKEQAANRLLKHQMGILTPQDFSELAEEIAGMTPSDYELMKEANIRRAIELGKLDVIMHSDSTPMREDGVTGTSGSIGVRGTNQPSEWDSSMPIDEFDDIPF
jgi:hypothetical protein